MKFYEHEYLKDAVRWYSYWNIHWNIPGYTKLLNIPLVIHKDKGFDSWVTEGQIQNVPLWQMLQCFLALLSLLL